MLEDLFLDESLQCIVARKSFLEESLLQGDLFWQNHCYKETFFFLENSLLQGDLSQILQ